MKVFVADDTGTTFSVLFDDAAGGTHTPLVVARVDHRGHDTPLMRFSQKAKALIRKARAQHAAAS